MLGDGRRGVNDRRAEHGTEAKLAGLFSLGLNRVLLFR